MGLCNGISCGMLSAKSWQPDAVLQLLLAILAGTALCTLPISIWYPKEAWNTADGRFLNFIVGSLSLQGVGLLVVNVFLRHHRVGWREAFGWRSAGLGKAL